MSEPAVLAAPPQLHCCASGFLHEGTPSGETIEIAGLKTYVARSKETTNKIVLFFPDVHGPFHINNSLLIDWFALQGCLLIPSKNSMIDFYFLILGYLVAAIDYFEGDPIHFAREREGEKFVMSEWLDIKLPRARTITPAWIDAVKATFGW